MRASGPAALRQCNVSELYRAFSLIEVESVGGALGRTVFVIRQQLSPREREIWFALASRRIRQIQETPNRTPRRKSATRKVRTSIRAENLLVVQHQVMSEEERAEWRENILRKTARLLEKSCGRVEAQPQSGKDGSQLQGDAGLQN